MAKLGALERTKQTEVYLDWTFFDQPQADSEEEDDESDGGESEDWDDIELFADDQVLEEDEDENEELEVEEDDQFGEEQ